MKHIGSGKRFCNKKRPVALLLVFSLLFLAGCGIAQKQHTNAPEETAAPSDISLPETTEPYAEANLRETAKPYAEKEGDEVGKFDFESRTVILNSGYRMPVIVSSITSAVITASSLFVQLFFLIVSPLPC